MIRRPLRAGAFSLVELLISFFVLLIGVLAILVLFPLGLGQSKQMVDQSMGALVARNARGLMEGHTFLYHDDSTERRGFGTASLINAKYGPKGTSGNYYAFPVMFPRDVLGDCDTAPDQFPIALRPIDSVTGKRDRMLEPTNPQFSWDARFTIGMGGMSFVAPPNVNQDAYLPAVKPIIPGNPSVNWDATGTLYWDWFCRYYKYYAVQISVYRNYDEVWRKEGTIKTIAAKKSDGTDYDLDDPNRPIYSVLEMTIDPGPDVVIGTAIRVVEPRQDASGNDTSDVTYSDWYKITQSSYKSAKWTFKLDRPYASRTMRNTGLPELDMANTRERSVTKTTIIATNTLVGTFTTILASQLDDVNSSSLTYP